MRLVSHPNVVDLKAFFYTNGEKASCSPLHSALKLIRQKDEVYLNLVLEFVPETVYRASRHYSKLKQVMPMLQVKLYMYQVGLSVNKKDPNTDDSSFDHWHTYTLLEFVIEISNLRISYSTPPPVSSCCVISDQPKSSLPVNQTSAISVRDTTELPN